MEMYERFESSLERYLYNISSGSLETMETELRPIGSVMISHIDR